MLRHCLMDFPMNFRMDFRSIWGPQPSGSAGRELRFEALKLQTLEPFLEVQMLYYLIIYTYIYICIFIYLYLYTYIRMSTSPYLSLYLYLYVYVNIDFYISIVYPYIHISISLCL